LVTKLPSPKIIRVRPKARLSFTPLGIKMQLLERDKVKNVSQEKTAVPKMLH